MLGVTALVVEADAMLRATLAAFLKGEGYRVLQAADAAEAIALLDNARRRVGVALLDLATPDLDGHAVLAHLQRRGRRDLPVLVFSGHHPDAALLAVLDHERRDFIAKPFDVGELRIRLRRLARPSSHHAEKEDVDAGDARDGGNRGDGVRVYTLGSLRVYRGDTLLFDESWRNKPAKSVFKSLLTARGQRHSKEKLAEDVWPETDAESVLNRLRVAVCDLRRQLGDPKARTGGTGGSGGSGGTGKDRGNGGDGLIVQQDGAYVFDPVGVCWTDVQAFDDAVRRGRQLARQGRIDDALASYRDADELYQGDYLADDPYSEPTIAERERLRQAYLSMLEEMASLSEQQGHVGEAVGYCRRILRLEPWREEVARRLMDYLARDGRRGEAVRVFGRCCQALESEGVVPSAATEQLWQRIAI